MIGDMPISSITLPDGRSLEILTGGDPDGFPWILHLGSPSGVVEFAPVDEAAQDAGFRLISYSRPGYGDSTPRAGVGMPRMADDTAETAALLDALGLDEFVTLGWSGGGPRALACGALLTSRCLAATSLAGPAPYDAVDWTQGMAPENVAEYAAAAAGREAYHAFLQEEFTPLLTITGPQLVVGMGALLSPVDQAAPGAGYADWLAAMMRRAGAQGVVGVREDGLAAVSPWGFEVSEVAVPTAIWQGREDHMVPPHHGEWLAAHVPHARAHVLDGEGHISLLHRLPEMLAELRELAGL